MSTPHSFKKVIVNSASFILATLVCALFSGCATPLPTRDVGEKLYHRNWWNYYARGVMRLHKKDLQSAMEDFETCLNLRRGAKYGYPIDKWRARTYGLHFIDNYFPNRELGVILYRSGEFERAAEFLEKSLKQEPSGRAKHYYNLSRRELLARQDLPPPSIEVDAASREVWTSARKRMLTGVARGPAFIRDVSIGDDRLFIELATEEQAFGREIVMKEGLNTIAITAEDLAGKKAEQSVTWRADWQPPQIVIGRSVRQGANWRITGVCCDNVALAFVEVNGRKQFASEPRKEVQEYPLKLEMPAKDGRLVIRTSDLAGNTLETVLTDTDLAASLMLHPIMRVAVEGDALPAAPQQGAEDTMKPRLQFTTRQQVVYVYDEDYYLDGEASDQGGLASIRVNGEEWLRKTHCGATRNRFAGYIPTEGSNTIHVVVSDQAGNQTAKTITVIRREPMYLDTEFRLTTGIPPFNKAEIGYKLTTGVTPLVKNEEVTWLDPALVKIWMEKYITRQPIRFHLLERDEGWDFILREQELSMSDLTDPRASLKIGKMLPAEMFFMGSLYKNGIGITIHISVVDTETGKTLFIEDVYTEEALNDAEKKISGLISKIEQRFPLVEAAITKISGSKVTLNAGLLHGVIQGTKFIIVKKQGNDHIEEGEVVHIEDKYVECYAKRIKREETVADLEPRSASDMLSVGDYIFTR